MLSLFSLYFPTHHKQNHSVCMYTNIFTSLQGIPIFNHDSDFFPSFKEISTFYFCLENLKTHQQNKWHAVTLVSKIRLCSYHYQGQINVPVHTDPSFYWLGNRTDGHNVTQTFSSPLYVNYFQRNRLILFLHLLLQPWLATVLLEDFILVFLNLNSTTSYFAHSLNWPRAREVCPLRWGLLLLLNLLHVACGLWSKLDATSLRVAS